MEKSQLFTTPDQYTWASQLRSNISDFYFFYYALSEIEKVINVHFMTVGNLTNTNLDYQAGIIALMLFNCWLSLHFWPVLCTNFCAVPPSP